MAAATRIQIHGGLNQSDIVKFAYFDHLRRFWQWIVACFLLPPFGLILILGAGTTDLLWNVAWCWLFLWAIGLALLAIPSLRVQTLSSELLKEPVKYTFTLEVIRMEGQTFSNEVAWHTVHSAYETLNAFLICTAPETTWIVPKRFFHGDVSVIAGCRRLITQGLGRKRQITKVTMLGSWF